MAAPRGGFTVPARPRDGKRIPGFVKWHGEKETATMHLRVLGYKEDGEWCALGLEMDLRGYGATFEEAMDELHNTIVDQFTFAMQMNNPDLLTFGAEQRYHAMYARAQQAAMSDYITGAHEAARSQLISELPVPLVEHIPSGMYFPAWQ